MKKVTEAPLKAYDCVFGRDYDFQASVCIATYGISVPSLHTESTDSVIATLLQTPNDCESIMETASAASSRPHGYLPHGPLYSTYVDTISQWWGDVIADEIGATDSRGYNIVNLSFWLANKDGTSHPVDIAIVWASPERFFDVHNSKFGSTPDEIRKNLRKAYHAQGARVLVSAFGATQFPTTQGIPATACGENLAQFVMDNQLDGVDLDYEDNAAMENGTAVPWLVEMTSAMLKKFKASGKRYIILHAPQAPYFMDGKYPKNYVALHNSGLHDGSTMGDHIDGYLVQFYNQGNSEYVCYKTLFEDADGWSSGSAVQQIADKGIPMRKISVGKPVTPQDVVNTGYVPPDELAAIFREARQPGAPWSHIHRLGGVVGWQFMSDPKGEWIAGAKDAIGNPGHK